VGITLIDSMINTSMNEACAILHLKNVGAPPAAVDFTYGELTIAGVKHPAPSPPQEPEFLPTVDYLVSICGQDQSIIHFIQEHTPFTFGFRIDYHDSENEPTKVKYCFWAVRLRTP